MQAPDNSRVSCSMDTCSDLNHALLYTATMDRDDGSNGAKRNRAAQSAVDRWANGVDSPCAAQTRPPPTKPERAPSSRCIDVLTESWCAALHQGVPCAQRQDVVVAHQPGAGGYFTNQFTPARERKCRLRWSGAVHDMYAGRAGAGSPSRRSVVPRSCVRPPRGAAQGDGRHGGII